MKICKLCGRTIDFYQPVCPCFRGTTFPISEKYVPIEDRIISTASPVEKQYSSRELLELRRKFMVEKEEELQFKSDTRLRDIRDYTLMFLNWIEKQ